MSFSATPMVGAAHPTKYQDRVLFRVKINLAMSNQIRPPVKFLWAPVLVFLSALFFSFIFYFIQIYSWNIEQQSATRFFQQSFSASINQFEYLPSLLAQDSQVKRALQYSFQDHSSVSERLKFVAERSGSSNVYVMNSSGKVIATSNYDQSNSFLNQNYSFRPYFVKAISELKRQFYYAVGATTGIPGFFISAPVIGQGDAVLGVVVVKLDLREWEKSWQEAGQNLLIADDNKVVILSGQEQWRYRSIGKLAQNIQHKISEHRQFQGVQPDSLFSDRFEFDLFNKQFFSFWTIDNDSYLVNAYNIADTGWTLYYLEKNKQYIYSAITFFLITLSGLVLSYLYLRERKSKLRSRQQARENEKRHRQELETIIQKIHIGVVSMNQSGEMLFINEVAENLLNINLQKLNKDNNNIQNFVDVSTVENFSELLKQRGDIVKPYHETTVLDQGKATTHVMFAISCAPLEGDNRLLMTLVNIEKRKQAEEAVISINASLEEQVEKRTRDLHNAQAELVQQSKIAALGQMAATIVHELSQPLSAMNSSIAAVGFKAEKNDWDGALKSISRLSPLSNKMHNVIKLLKSFSYADEPLKDGLELAPLIKQSLSLFKDSLREKNVMINLLELEKSVYVKVNTLKLDLVLVNLIQNALDAMEKTNHPVITVGMHSFQNNALITIEDVGGGIDSRVMGQLFNPYFTTKEIGKGLGLGLSICYEIIQEYGGSIDAENTEQGARFIIKLPLDQVMH